MSIKLPVIITFFDPHLSSNFPITGAAKAIVITRGRTIKLAEEIEKTKIQLQMMVKTLLLPDLNLIPQIFLLQV